jgi:hypothetical protein
MESQVLFQAFIAIRPVKHALLRHFSRNNRLNLID